MFVDDLLSAIAKHLDQTDLLIASSVESIYLLLGYPGDFNKPELPATMTVNKMTERPVAPTRVSLGIRFKNVRLILTTEDYKVLRLINIIDTQWNFGIKRFKLLTAAKLIRNVIAATVTCP